MNWFVKNTEKAMGITIKGFKTFAGRGEHGPKGGFEGTAMLDGKPIATFADANDGGMLDLRDTQIFKDLAKKNFEDEPYNRAAEKLVYFLVGHHETLQKMKRLCKNKFLAITTDCQEGEFLQCPVKYSESVATQFREKNPGIYIINEHL